MEVWGCEGARVCRCEGVKAGGSLPVALQKRLLHLLEQPCCASCKTHLAHPSTCAPFVTFCFLLRDKDRSLYYFAAVTLVVFLGVCGSPPGCVCMRALLGGVPEPPAGGLVGGGQWQEGEEQAPARSVRELAGDCGGSL